MNNGERLLREINTPEGKENFKKWAEKYLAEEKEKNIKMKELLSNTDYINWLVNFTKKHTNFSDDDWLYFSEKIAKEDLERVNNLHLIYHGIEKYANENYIYPTECDFGNFYKIKLENIGFEIGMLVGQGTVFFCKRVQVIDSKDFIDFYDIINNKKNKNATTIKNKLNKLFDLVVSLHKSDVPLEAIEITLDNALNEIKSKNDLEKKKILKRK